nr:immunoglobulin heavy chain junction region [Macaca mulatta]MOV59273.1 immunoglobulin heavy chain junction region [Macaca mulatta]
CARDSQGGGTDYW